jgi:formyltetrahydrofolate synthetase
MRFSNSDGDDNRDGKKGKRQIVIGLGGPRDGFTMGSHFQIAVSSELMAILAMADSLADLRALLVRANYEEVLPSDGNLYVLPL